MIRLEIKTFHKVITEEKLPPRSDFETYKNEFIKFMRDKLSYFTSNKCLDSLKTLKIWEYHTEIHFDDKWVPIMKLLYKSKMSRSPNVRDFVYYVKVYDPKYFWMFANYEGGGAVRFQINSEGDFRANNNTLRENQAVPEASELTHTP